MSASLRVGEVMHPGILTCGRDDPLSLVAEMMAGRQIHCVVVTDDPGDGGAFFGIVSDLDLVAAASVRDLDEQTAGAAAATIPLAIGASDTLQRAAQIMTQHATTHLLVLDHAYPVGVVSALDIAAALSQRAHGTADA